MWDAMIRDEELAHISSYQTLLVDKKSKSYKARTKLVKKAGSYMSH